MRPLLKLSLQVNTDDYNNTNVEEKHFHDEGQYKTPETDDNPTPSQDSSS